MAKMTAADITAITAEVEEIEKNGGKPYALLTFTGATMIPGETGDLDPWVPASRTFWGIDTLEGWKTRIRELGLPGYDPFCEEVTGGVRSDGRRLYAAPGQPLEDTVWMCWSGCPSELIENPATVWFDFEDDDLDPWGELDYASAEPLPVTPAALASYAKHVLTIDRGSAEVTPAREFIARLAQDLGGK